MFEKIIVIHNFIVTALFELLLVPVIDIVGTVTTIHRFGKNNQKLKNASNVNLFTERPCPALICNVNQIHPKFQPKSNYRNSHIFVSVTLVF